MGDIDGDWTPKVAAIVSSIPKVVNLIQSHIMCHTFIFFWLFFGVCFVFGWVCVVDGWLNGTGTRRFRSLIRKDSYTFPTATTININVEKDETGPVFDFLVGFVQ